MKMISQQASHAQAGSDVNNLVTDPVELSKIIHAEIEKIMGYANSDELA